jgi:hypothetical protein
VTEVILKTCRKCGHIAYTEEQLNSFIAEKRAKYGKSAICKTCALEWQREYRKKQTSLPAADLKKYGISPDDYNQMFANQKGTCLICETHQNDLEQKLCVDHCHSTSKVRGLICKKCNLLLGHAKDNIVILQSAINYLLEDKL